MLRIRSKKALYAIINEIQKLYFIDKDGNVYYIEGVKDNISIGSLDLTDCVVLHNHPAINGILSFGEDELQHYVFECLREEGYVEYVRKAINKKPKRWN